MPPETPIPDNIQTPAPTSIEKPFCPKGLPFWASKRQRAFELAAWTMHKEPCSALPHVLSLHKPVIFNLGLHQFSINQCAILLIPCPAPLTAVKRMVV